MLALCSEGTGMGRKGEKRGWYTATAAEALRELGARRAAMILDRLSAIIV